MANPKIDLYNDTIIQDINKVNKIIGEKWILKKIREEEKRRQQYKNNHKKRKYKSN